MSEKIKETEKSDINGEGWGSSHIWKHDLTDMFRDDWGSRYFCSSCGVCFVHMYNHFPDVFEAMENELVPNMCEGKKP